MKSLEERLADRAKRRQLNAREISPRQQQLKPQDQVDYGDMKLAELRELAKERDLKVEGTKKDDFVAALEADDAAEDEPVNGTPAIPPIPPMQGGQPWGNN